MFYTLCYKEFIMKKETTIIITPNEIKELISDKYKFNIKNIEFVFINKTYKAGLLDGVQLYDEMKVFNGIKIKVIDNV